MEQGIKLKRGRLLHHKMKRLKQLKIRNITLNTIGIVLAIVVIGWAAHYFWRYTIYEITNDAVVDQYITPVSVRVAGYIKEVRFTEHQQVKAGDTLLVLDDREFHIKLMDAQAALMDANASSASLHSSINTTKSNVNVSSENIAEAKARLWKLEQDEKRYAALLKEESVTGQQYEQVKSELDAMRARYEALRDQKISVESQSSEAKEKTGSATALILRKKADVEMAKLNLSYTVVTAPFDGFMGRRSLETGQLIQAGQMISNIIRNNEKWITANYKETQIAHIYVGQDVQIKVDALEGKIFHGKVTAISEATGSKYSLLPNDNSAGNFVKVQQRIPVRIELTDILPQDKVLLRAGMMVETEAKIRK